MRFQGEARFLFYVHMKNLGPVGFFDLETFKALARTLQQILVDFMCNAKYLP